MTADFFSSDYFTARDRFRAAAASLGWSCEVHPISGRGPGGEELTLDAALSPSARVDAGKVLVLSSGLHGVEGFFGSAVQLAFLESLAAGEIKLPVRCVLLHGLNPFGFAWLRRTDEANIDNNRNFLVAGEEFKGSPPLYKSLDPLINPTGPTTSWDFFYPRLALSALRHGMRVVKQAIAAGQYDSPRGLFFGGHGPSETQRIVAEVLPRVLADAKEVIHFDYHTGLGPFARGKLLLDAPLTAQQQERLDDWLGRDTYEPCSESPTSYTVRGGIGNWCVQKKLVQDYLYLCAEFGTYPSLQVLAGLRAENRAWQLGSRSTRQEADFKELFCPASEVWRKEVIGRNLSWLQTILTNWQRL